MQPFGEWIKSERVKKRIGLWRCAGYASIGGEALRLIETGKTNPADCKASTLYGLARTLELDLAEVIERAVRQDGESIKLLEFGQNWRAGEREDAETCYQQYLASQFAHEK
jgi:hypothetical protein